ncbi:hypothetical protein CRYUN_Cryun06bG0150400 [Craigia yunnanensis]
MVEEGERSTFGKSNKFLRDCIQFHHRRQGHYKYRPFLVFLAFCNASIRRKQNLEEIKVNSPTSRDRKLISFSGEELNKFIYLHAALCVTFGPYPPLPVNSKTAIKSDVLPSGDRVDEGARIFISVFSMGRMEEIRVQGQEFFLGKDSSKQMKTVAINVLWNSQVEVAEFQTVSPSSQAIELHFENGLKFTKPKPGRAPKLNLNNIMINQRG